MIFPSQHLVCDGPASECPFHGVIAITVRGSIPMMRDRMWELGWRRVARMDLCPDCLRRYRRKRKTRPTDHAKPGGERR